MWWSFAALGGLALLGGLISLRFPAKTLDYLDTWGIPVNGVPRTVGGIRTLGVIFTLAGTALVVAGFLMLFGVISPPQ